MSISEASAVARIFDSQRLRVARQARKVTRAVLANRVGVSTAAVGQWEAGTVRPKAQTVVLIAEALAFPIGFFATSGRTSENLTAQRTFFRSLRKSRGIDREAAMAHAILLAELVRVIERYAELPALTIPALPVGSDASNEKIDTAAMRVREEWDLGDEPVADVVLQLERHGAVTARLGLAEDVDAFSWPGLDRPIVILGKDKADRARSRFDAAHELAHLVMHRDHPRAGDRDLERQAHRFASAFLLPAGRLEAEWPRGRLNWLALIALKGRWQMSIAALLYRARTDGLISETTYESAAKYLSRAGWRRREPGPLGPPESPRLVQEAIRLLHEGGIGIATLAAEAGLPSDVIALHLEATGRDARVEVVV